MASFIIFLLSATAFLLVGLVVARLLNSTANSIEKDNAKAEKEIKYIKEERENNDER